MKKLLDAQNGSDADQTQDSCNFQSQNSFTGYDDSLFSYYGISQPATIDTNDKENFNSENALEPASHSLDITMAKSTMKLTPSQNESKKSFYDAVVSNSSSALKSSSGSNDQFDAFFATKMTDIVKSTNNEPIIKPKSTEQKQQSPAKSNANTTSAPFINTFKLPETNDKPTKNESEENDYKNYNEEEPKRKPKVASGPISSEASATNEKFNKLFNRTSSNMSEDLTSSLLIPTCFDDQSSKSAPGFNFAALNNDVSAS